MSQRESPDVPITWTTPHLLRINHPHSFGPAAQAEVRALGFEPVDAGDTGFNLRGSMLDTVRLNRWLRVSHSVLVPLISFTARHLRQFQDILRKFPWEKWIRHDRTLCVESFASTVAIRDGRIVNQGAKDAIVDRLREVHGVRPDSGPEPDQTVVFIFWNQHHVHVYLNSSGRSLSHRGYRTDLTHAPLRESLAAVCVLRSGWDGTRPLVNPMCGSGTLAIEAALYGAGRPPRSEIRSYGYQHWIGYRPEFESTGDAPPAGQPTGKPRILATDSDRRSIEVARRAAMAAGVEDLIEFQECRFEETPMPAEPAVVLVNPPYGERLDPNEDLRPLYRDIGKWFREKCPGSRCCVLTANAEAAMELKLKTTFVEALVNGTLVCKWLGFDIRERAPLESAGPPS